MSLKEYLQYIMLVGFITLKVAFLTCREDMLICNWHFFVLLYFNKESTPRSIIYCLGSFQITNEFVNIILGYEFSILNFLASKEYQYQNAKSFIRLMLLSVESKSGAKDIHSSSV